MARARDPARDQAFEIYKNSNGEKLLKDIAAEIGKGEGTVRGWKNKDKWDAKLNGTFQTEERNAPKKNKERSNNDGDTEIKVEPPPRKDNRVKRASGNPNPQNQFTKRNRAAMIHGLRSKFFYEEQLEIMEALQEFDVIDQIWLQIEISFSAIVRAQKIMWVEDSFDHLKEVSEEMEALEMSKTSYKVVYAHERFESYIKAQTRAMAEHRSLVKQFLDLTTEDDERRLKLQQMQQNIEKNDLDIKLKQKEIEVLNKAGEGNDITINFVRKSTGDS